MGDLDPPGPRLLGRYALYERIAVGGMASVHIGRLLGPVGFARTVAIKRMHPQFAEDPEFVSMFVDEARLAARIRHPNVVPTLDVVSTQGELFLVMEFVQGESLAGLIRAAGARGERIPAGMVATMMVGALHGLHAAHEAKNDRGEPLGIVHRDVSPQNILVGTDGVARVLDFGVAKAAGRIQTTREGQLKGKLAYMAPEQVRGEVSRVADVYAASVVLWEALTGKRLFQGANEAVVLDRVLKGCDTPPSKFAPDLPPAVDEVTMRGLSADPAKRFPTAREMARTLEDAMPLAQTSKVGDWVEEAAKATLGRRSVTLASIESDSSLHVQPQLPPASPPPGDGTLTQLSSSSVSSPGPASLAGARRRRVWFAAAAGVLLLLTVGLAATVSRRSSVVPAPAVVAMPAGAPAEPAPAAAASRVPSLPEAPAESAASTVIPAATTPARATATPAPTPVVAAPERAQPRARGPSRATAAPPAADCDPPYTLDDQGRKYFKPECFTK